VIGIHFDKIRAQEILDAISQGKPIAPGYPGGWKQYDMLALAGALHFACLSQGPTMFHVRGVPEAEENQEADWDVFQSDLLGAIYFYSQLTMAVKDEQYDAKCDPTAKAVLNCQIDDFKTHERAVEGFKR
jgi:hypothetical protein